MLKNYFSARKKLYPQNVKGKFRSLKTKLNIIFLSIYCLTPFLKFDRGPNVQNQAVLIDIVNSKIYFFFIEIWAQETYYLAGILIISAVTLFFVTSLFGRIWCGYACFQTVWTDIFIIIERIFQGDRNQRILLDRNHNFKKFYKKFLTHLSWIIFSLLTALCFVCYFNDAYLLVKKIFLLNFNEISLKIYGWIFGIASMTYIMAGFAREQVCTYMCPYARFQSAMFDDNTLIISYDKSRGEPRQKWHQGEDFANRGHCIDCKQCVVVCPTGIDIRNGLQMECIACGLCIDACDNIMEKVGLPKGLIRYDTLAHLSDPTPQKKFRFLQPRTFYYGFILLVISSLMLLSLMTKSTIEISVYQERNPLYVVMSDGSLRNIYNVKIINKTHHTKNFKVSVMQSDLANIDIVNHDVENLKVEAETAKDFRTTITIANDKITKITEDEILLTLKILDIETNEEKNVSIVFIKE